ncbi:putative orphan protein [Pseudoalteromonas translucida]|uniref:Orphan protein n=1 Tax=Pseudoalteromonas translucida (strain TAC 125) TaxID=326442 RepID=Q3IJM8_PSET1|nr:putative orphan protein [Pseudoalteromonas translucida]
MLVNARELRKVILTQKDSPHSAASNYSLKQSSIKL